MEIPVIETQRLRLRPYRSEDFSPCAANWADPIVIRHTSGKPLAPEEVWGKMLRNIGLWPMLGFGYWAVEEKATGEFIGEVGFADFKRAIEASLDGIPEIGWILASRVHGKGYATEAVGVLVAWADRHLAGERTVCLIHPQNAASLRVAEKCGYREFQRAPYKEQNVILLERRNPAL